MGPSSIASYVNSKKVQSLSVIHVDPSWVGANMHVGANVHATMCMQQDILQQPGAIIYQ